MARKSTEVACVMLRYFLADMEEFFRELYGSEDEYKALLKEETELDAILRQEKQDA